jgi:hypothetical protein
MKANGCKKRKKGRREKDAHTIKSRGRRNKDFPKWE